MICAGGMADGDRLQEVWCDAQGVDEEELALGMLHLWHVGCTSCSCCKHRAEPEIRLGHTHTHTQCSIKNAQTQTLATGLGSQVCLSSTPIATNPLQQLCPAESWAKHKFCCMDHPAPVLQLISLEL